MEKSALAETGQDGNSWPAVEPAEWNTSQGAHQQRAECCKDSSSFAGEVRCCLFFVPLLLHLIISRLISPSFWWNYGSCGWNFLNCFNGSYHQQKFHLFTFCSRNVGIYFLQLFFPFYMLLYHCPSASLSHSCTVAWNETYFTALSSRFGFLMIKILMNLLNVPSNCILSDDQHYLWATSLLLPVFWMWISKVKELDSIIEEQKKEITRLQDDMKVAKPASIADSKLI